MRSAHVAQSVEHFLGKEEVTGSIPVVGLKDRKGSKYHLVLGGDIIVSALLLFIKERITRKI
jgi:hypothetical protein